MENASTGNASAMAPPTAATWRHPKWNWRTSSMKAATPSPTASEIPSAAGTRSPSTAGIGTSKKKRDGSQTHANETSASTHARVAHTNRGPEASPSTSSAVPDDHPAREPGAVRPGLEPQDLREAVVELEREPECSEPVTGAQVGERPRQQQHEADAGCDHRWRSRARAARRRPGRSAARASARARRGAAAGSPVATRPCVSATSAPVATTARHQRRGVASGRYPPTRKQAGDDERRERVQHESDRSGRSANALRGSGLIPYASAATIAALPGPVMRRPSRQAPNTPNGSAPTTIDGAGEPGRAEQQRPEHREHAELGGGGSGRAEVGVPPGRGERLDEPADAGPARELADHRQAPEDQRPRSDEHQDHERPVRRAMPGRARRLDALPGQVPAAFRDRADAVLGVQRAGDVAAHPRAAADLERPQVDVRDAPQRLRGVACLTELAEVAHVPHPRADQRLGAVAPTGQRRTR